MKVNTEVDATRLKSLLDARVWSEQREEDSNGSPLEMSLPPSLIVSEGFVSECSAALLFTYGD